ncbi:MAG TPA: hypothetical protein K8W06_00380, partial [Limosilactobacillus coleohominis]|nr:hypothetical protein [Limosilactobacillus coleohominis]
ELTLIPANLFPKHLFITNVCNNVTAKSGRQRSLFRPSASSTRNKEWLQHGFTKLEPFIVININ